MSKVFLINDKWNLAYMDRAMVPTFIYLDVDDLVSLLICAIPEAVCVWSSCV